MSFASDPVFHREFRRLAVTFILRANLFAREEDAKHEVDMIFNRIGVENYIAAIGGKFENEAYITMVRVGARVVLSRLQRIDIARVVNNAANHASVEAGYM